MSDRPTRTTERPNERRGDDDDEMKEASEDAHQSPRVTGDDDTWDDVRDRATTRVDVDVEGDIEGDALATKRMRVHTVEDEDKE